MAPRAFLFVNPSVGSEWGRRAWDRGPPHGDLYKGGSRSPSGDLLTNKVGAALGAVTPSAEILHAMSPEYFPTANSPHVTNQFICWWKLVLQVRQVRPSLIGSGGHVAAS